MDGLPNTYVHMYVCMYVCMYVHVLNPKAEVVHMYISYVHT